MFRLRRDTRSKGRHYALVSAVFVLSFVAMFGLLWVQDAQALRLSMKRIIFEGPKRSDVLTIMNNTAKEQTYRLGWRHYRMDEKKSLVYIPEGDATDNTIKWADDMVKYAPRRVTVPPGGSQQIRLLFRRPRDLAPGEYRSHLWIVTEAEPGNFIADENNNQKGQQAFRLTMQPALTLPIFVRAGDLTSSASITDAKVSKTDKGGSIHFVLNREGNRSLYGDLKIICAAGGQEFEASYTRGIAVYTEISKRVFDYDFPYPPEQAANCAKVRIEYIADKDDVLYSGQMMAKATAVQ